MTQPTTVLISRPPKVFRALANCGSLVAIMELIAQIGFWSPISRTSTQSSVVATNTLAA